MQLLANETSDALFVHINEDRIDAASAIQFKDKMRILTQSPLKRVVLDMTHVNFLDSSGLGAVVAIMKQLSPERQLELANLTPTVEKVFRLTRMDSVFTIHKNLSQDLHDED